MCEGHIECANRKRGQNFTTMNIRKEKNKTKMKKIIQNINEDDVQLRSSFHVSGKRISTIQSMIMMQMKSALEPYTIFSYELAYGLCVRLVLCTYYELHSSMLQNEHESVQRMNSLSERIQNRKPKKKDRKFQ